MVRVLIINKNEVTAPRDGGSLRVRAIVDELSAVPECEVQLIAVRSSGSSPRHAVSLADYTWAIRVLLRYLRLSSLSCLRWYKFSVAVSICAAVRQSDVCVVEHTQLAPYVAGLPTRLHLDMHNVESQLMQNYADSARGLRRLVASWEARMLKTLELETLNAFKDIFVVSARDRAQLNARRVGTAVVRVASNGVNDDAFEAPVALHDEKLVTFVGHLGWRPNVDAAKWLALDVWPIVVAKIPDARLVLVGRSPAKELEGLVSSSIEIHGDVASVLPFLSAARAATAPLLAAGGTRLKIIEALATGTPVVATPLGALGLEELQSESLRIASSAQDFADSLLDVLRNPPSPAEARELAQAYQWRVTLAPLVRAVTL